MAETETLDLLAPKAPRKRGPASNITAAEVEALLRDRYSAPEYAFLRQVRNGTGFSRGTTRTADGLAFSLWPSRGLGLYGFEIKVSRSDWLNEIREPAKAEEIQRFCDGWYLVAGHGDIVQFGELPITWGLLVVRAGRLVCEKEAPKLQAQALDLPQLAAIFRSIVAADEKQINAAVRLAIEAAKAEHEKEIKALRAQHTEDLERKTEHLRALINAFEAASGVQIDGYKPANQIGAAVRWVLDHQGYDGERRTRIEQALRTARETVAALEQIDALQKSAASGIVSGKAVA